MVFRSINDPRSGFFIPQARHFIYYNLITVVSFGVIYYILQFVDKPPFVSNQAIQDQHVHKSKQFTLIECIHFSLVTQTTIGYGGMIPLSNACVLVNSVQLFSIFWITATAISR